MKRAFFQSARLLIILDSIIAVAFSWAAAPVRASAPDGVPLWTNVYAFPSSSYSFDQAWGISVDTLGNAFVTGRSWTGSSYVYATISYSSAGKPLWTNWYSGSANDNLPSAIGVSSSGIVFVTGSSTENNYAPFNYDFCTIAYSTLGAPLWTNRYNGLANGDDEAWALAIDPAGNVFVAGVSTGSSTDGLTIGYSSAGIPLWTNRYTRPGLTQEEELVIATDTFSNVLVSGQCTDVTNSSCMTIKYAANGLPLWSNQYYGGVSNRDLATALVVSANGTVFLAGVSSAPATNPTYFTIAYSGSGVALWTNLYNGPGLVNTKACGLVLDSEDNLFVTAGKVTIKYSSLGAALWTNAFDGDVATAIGVDAKGNVFVTGTSGSSFDTVAYSGAGVALWTNRYTSPGDGQGSPMAIAVDNSGNVFVTGYASFGVSPAYNERYVTIKYSAVAPSPIPLLFQRSGNKLVLSWTNGGLVLQSASSLSGVFTNVPDATNPYTNPLVAPQGFFRLISQ